ncbi:hypothetical protein I7I50_07347 [Histoplasma capsulatum G186AR]|uniref:Uncharacterized protein n=1 Tax=Ajellomyces capsulatus TaxID=5037 RepID=A0A8H7YY22_AJECA|nr:hypothetical protein I7I52_09581 [Histoplasma capsulatum]QSS68063.1 hypothetical protein I7I50_07347 [Histoplasma capsulatum G186AR]
MIKNRRRSGIDNSIVFVIFDKLSLNRSASQIKGQFTRYICNFSISFPPYCHMLGHCKAYVCMLITGEEYKDKWYIVRKNSSYHNYSHYYSVQGENNNDLIGVENNFFPSSVVFSKFNILCRSSSLMQQQSH